MSNNTKKYLVGLCHYIDCIFTLSFMVLFIRCLWYMGVWRPRLVVWENVKNV